MNNKSLEGMYYENLIAGLQLFNKFPGVVHPKGSSSSKQKLKEGQAASLYDL
jgi:hypothetical protein